MGRAMSRHFASKQCRNRVSKMTGKHDRSPKKTRLKLVLRMQHNTNLMVSREGENIYEIGFEPTTMSLFTVSAVRQTEVSSLVIRYFWVCHVIFWVCHVMSKLKNPVWQLLDGIVIRTFKKCQIFVLWTKVVISCKEFV